MSPKSRRRPGRSRRSAPRLGLTERLLLDARRIADAEDPLGPEGWASGWLGRVWAAAPPGEEEPEYLLCKDVAGRVAGAPSPVGAAAVAALWRVAPEDDRPMLARAKEMTAARVGLPAWADAPAWPITAAWRAIDVWGSARTLFAGYGGPHPHTLIATVAEDVGRTVTDLTLAGPEAAERWDALRGPQAPPMPVVPEDPEVVLADLAAAMRETDMAWPRHDDERYVTLRALAWSRARPFLPPLADWNPTPARTRQALVEEFAACGGLPDDDVTRSLAELFLDHGDATFGAGPLAWSPERVALFLVTLPGKVHLDAEQRRLLPEALRRWVRFALSRRGVEPRWIEPVVEAVDVYAEEYRPHWDVPER